MITLRDISAFISPSKKITFASQVRTYRFSKPKNAIESIIIGLHGFGDSSRRFAYYTSLHNLANKNTLVVYPDATKPKSSDLKTGWNAGFCCGSGWVNKVDDVGFLVSLIEFLKKEHSAQDAKVFMTGFSNGAFMAQRFAAERPDLLDAVAVSAGTIGTTSNRLEPSQPMPILLMHGEKDERVSYSGGAKDSDPEFDWLSFEETKAVWQKVNADKGVTKVITYPDNKHEWDDWRLLNVWNKKPNASREVINFFYSFR